MSPMFCCCVILCVGGESSSSASAAAASLGACNETLFRQIEDFDFLSLLGMICHSNGSIILITT